MTTTTPAPRPPAPPRARSPFSTWWWIGAACFMGLLLVAAIITFTGHTRTDTTPVAVPAAESGPACEAGEAEQTGITGTPAHTWVLVGTLNVPASDTAGPSEMVEGVRSCWEQSPTGAVFAAAYMVGLGSTGQSRVLLEELTADSPGRAALLASVPESTVPGARKVQLVGFKVLDYTPERARVQIAATIDDTFHQALTQDLVWEGDWRLYVPSTGDTERTPLATTEGFTPFAAHPEGV